MYRYILFDLDGTLTDPKEGICKSVQYALHSMGIEEADLDKLEPFIGPPLIDSFMQFYKMKREDAEKAVVAYRERFSAVGLYENKVYKEIPELLAECKAQGMKIAVASSKPEIYVNKILKHFDLAKYFDVVVGSELDGRKTKKEEVVAEALKKLKCDKKQTVMIGDRCFDIEGAKAQGIASIGVEYGYAAKGELKKSGADYIAKNVKQLKKILLDENATNAMNLVGETNKGKPSREKVGHSTEKVRHVFFQVVEPPLPDKSLTRAVFMLAPFILYFIVFQLVEILAVIFIQLLTGEKDISNVQVMNITPSLLSPLIGMTAMFIGAMVLLIFYHKTDRMPFRIELNLLEVATLGITAAIGLNLLFEYICNLIPINEKSYEAAQFNSGIPYGIGLLVYVLVSPIAEEFVFRWLIFGRVKRALGSIIAVVVSALFFGCYHGNLLQGIYAFLMGLILAFVYEWTDSLLHPIAIHVAANCIVFSMAYIPESVSKYIASPAGCVISLIIAGVLLVNLYKKRL